MKRNDLVDGAGLNGFFRQAEDYTTERHEMGKKERDEAEASAAPSHLGGAPSF